MATPPIAIPTIAPTPSLEELLPDFSVELVESPVLAWFVAKGPRVVVEVVSESPDEPTLDADVRPALAVGFVREDVEEIMAETEEITDPDAPVAEGRLPI